MSKIFFLALFNVKEGNQIFLISENVFQLFFPPLRYFFINRAKNSTDGMWPNTPNHQLLRRSVAKHFFFNELNLFRWGRRKWGSSLSRVVATERPPPLLHLAKERHERIFDAGRKVVVRRRAHLYARKVVHLLAPRVWLALPHRVRCSPVLVGQDKRRRTFRHWPLRRGVRQVHLSQHFALRN